MHRTTSAPRTPNPDVDKGESSAPQKSTVIRLRIAEQKSHDELEAKQNVQKVEEHLITKEIEKLVEGMENVANVEITTEVQLVNVNEEEEESADDDFKLKRREKEKNDIEKLQELTVTDPKPSSSTPSSSSPKLKLSASQHILSLFKPKTGRFKCYKSFFDELQGCYGYLFEHLKKMFMPRKKFHGENSAKRQKTFEHGTYVLGESSSGQVNESEPGPSTSGNQEQLDDFDFWTDSYATDDDELPTEKVSQELVEEMSQTVDEAKLRKVVNEMLRQRCTSGDEHQYHIDQMQNFLKNDIKGTRDLEDVMSLRKFPAVIFPDDDIEERTSRWVDKYVKKFNPYARYNYKNVNKNNIEDMYLLAVNGKVDDYAETRLLWSFSVFIRSKVIWERVHDFQLGVESYQQKVNLNAPTIIFPCIKKYKVFSIVSELIYDIIYKNNKKEKRVMRHQ
ncbi:hypothetical protein Tco_0861917 [Tanacetum coccineum]